MTARRNPALSLLLVAASLPPLTTVQCHSLRFHVRTLWTEVSPARVSPVIGGLKAFIQVVLSDCFGGNKEGNSQEGMATSWPDRERRRQMLLTTFPLNL